MTSGTEGEGQDPPANPGSESALPVINYALVLDDDEGVLSTAVRLATRAGYFSIGTDSIGKFIEQYKKGRPTFLVLDVILGNQDVLSVVDFLAQEKCQAPIVFMSGFDHRVLNAVQTAARDRGLQVVGTVEKGEGLGRLTHILTTYHIGPTPG